MTDFYSSRPISPEPIVQKLPLSWESKLGTPVLTVICVTGAVFLILGSLELFGARGTMGFIATVGGGSLLTIVSAGACFWLFICKKEMAVSSKKMETLKDQNEINKDWRRSTNLVRLRDSLLISKDELAGLEPDETCSAITNYPAVGQEAFIFADKQLETENPGKYDFSTDFTCCSSATEKIERLMQLLDSNIQQFEVLLKDHPDNPWSYESIVENAISLMKISYVVTCLTLDAIEGEEASITAANLKQHYAYLTLSQCYVVYQMLRGYAFWLKEAEKILVVPVPPNEHIIPFYKSGTEFNSCRELYNDCCIRIQHSIDEGKLPRVYFSIFTFRDIRPDVFKPV